MASNFTLREMDRGSTEIVGVGPTLPLKVDDENLGASRRDASQLRSKIEHTLEVTAADP